MFKMKRTVGCLVAIVLAVAMLMSLSGCSNSNKNSDSKVIISCIMFDVESVGHDEMWEFIEDKFNVEFEFISVTEDDFEEKTQLLIATNEMPDLMWLDLDESNFSTYANWVQQESFSPMPSLEELKEKYPNLYNLYTADNNYGDELMTINGLQYAHPCIRDNADVDFLSGMGWMYRRDWAKELGLYKENDIYTWDEWVDLCQAFIDKDPGGNGAKNIGMGTASYYFPSAFGVYQSSSEYGFGTFTLVNGNYQWTAAQDETLLGLKEAKKLWDNGLIWQDNFLGTSPDSYYTSGLMGMIFQNFTVGRYNTFLQTVKDDFPEKNAEDVCALAKVIGQDGTYWAKQSQCYYGVVTMSANISDEVKERWLTMLDWFVSKEGNLFIQYGIEGKDYEIVDGSVKCLWEESEDDPSILIDPYPDGARLFYECYVGAVDVSIAPPVIYSMQAIDAVNSQYKYMLDNAFIRRFDYQSSYISTPKKDAYPTLQTDMESKMAEIIVNGSAETLENEWNAWVSDKMPKVQEIIDELNVSIEDKPIEHIIKYAE